MSTLAVGRSVWMNVNGVRTEFIIVHQGKPSSIYDDSCNGTWLLMKDIYSNHEWNSDNKNDYENSTIHAYLNETFLALFDTNVRGAIKQVKIPYRQGNATGNNFVMSGANGLPAKIFLLSATELGLSNRAPTNEGAKLSYFSSCIDGDDVKRVAYLNGSTYQWWLRSPSVVAGSSSLVVTNNGGVSWYYCSNWYGVRPALILASDTKIDDNYNIKV